MNSNSGSQPGLPERDVYAIQALGRVLRPELVDTVLAQSGHLEKRRRRLPMRLVLALVVAMALFSHNDISQCLAELIDRWILRCKKGTNRRGGSWVPPVKSSIAKARRRLGVVPVRQLFEKLAGPVAGPQTPGAFLDGLRLMLIDGSTLRTPDTRDNLRAFGRPSTGRAPSAYPALRFVVLVEAGTHVICDAELGPFRRSEQAMMLRIVQRGKIGSGMLVLWDRGLYSLAMVRIVLGQGAHFLCRISKNIRPEFVQALSDGSWLGRIYPHGSRNVKRAIVVRIIDYEVRNGQSITTIRLMTSLCNHQKFPASVLAGYYHERWEVENTVDEIKTHELSKERPTHLRSLLARNVVQEFYGMLLAHLAIRTLMHEASSQHHVDPDRLSFTSSLRIVRRHIVKSSSMSTSPLLPSRNC